MALNLPSVKPKPPSYDYLQFEEDGSGLGNISLSSEAARSQISHRHPLEHVLKNNAEHQDALQRSVMFHAQGPAGPMIHAVEMKAVSSVGHFPFLQCSNFQRDVLTGRDEEIDFEDVFGVVPRYTERAINPHTVMETYKFRSF